MSAFQWLFTPQSKDDYIMIAMALVCLLALIVAGLDKARNMYAVRKGQARKKTPEALTSSRPVYTAPRPLIERRQDKNSGRYEQWLARMKEHDHWKDQIASVKAFVAAETLDFQYENAEILAIAAQSGLVEDVMDRLAGEPKKQLTELGVSVRQHLNPMLFKREHEAIMADVQGKGADIARALSYHN